MPITAPRLARPTLGDALAIHDNSLGAVRLLLAAAVIVAHAWPLGGYGGSRMEVVGDVAVDGFFVISGYLIAGSRMRSDIGHYLSRRARRIFPGYWVSLVAVAFLFAPLAGLINGRGWDSLAAVSYVVDNATLIVTQETIGPTLSGAHAIGRWNGPLWTLAYEFGAYLLCGALLGVVWVRRHLVGTAAALTVGIPALAWWLGDLGGADGKIAMSALRFFAFFAAGMLAYALRGRLRTSTPVAVGAAALVVVLALLGEHALNLFAPVPLAYVLLHVGATWRTRLASGDDYSYGMYVYGWPVQQILALLGVGALVPVWGFAALSVAATVPVAILSWRLVERPAMRAGRARRVEPATAERTHRSVTHAVAARHVGTR